MLPIHILGGQSRGQALLTLVLTLVPALIAWWNDRHLLNKADDPALPELLANRRRLNVRPIAVAVALMIVFGGAARMDATASPTGFRVALDLPSTTDV